MKFNEYIQTKGVYENLNSYGFGIIKKDFTKNSDKFLINQEEGEEILSRVYEDLVKNNPEVIEITFKRGYFAKYVRFKTLGYINSKHKKRLIFGNKESLKDLKVEEYKEYKRDLSKISSYPELLTIYNDRFESLLSVKQVLKKNRITQYQYDVRMSNIKKLLQGQTVKIRQEKTTKIKMKIEEKYKGVCRIDATGNINKVYPKMVDVEKDGLDRTMVSKIVNGKYKHRNYEGFDWWFIKDLKEQNGKEKSF